VVGSRRDGCCLHRWWTYSRRTEKADTTIAFNLSLMRRDQTNNSEMLKMNTSSTIAVISIPRHIFHCSKSVSRPVSRAILSLCRRGSDKVTHYIDALPSIGSAPWLWQLALERGGEQAY
jgi:hypothetical protein